MQVILKPVSHPDLGEIVIRDRLFPIGRQEPPFASYGPDVVAKLSRRHARIFEQDNAIYLVDLDSLNGTTVNGKPLEKQPTQLRQNDEICFAGYLTYSIQLLGSSAKDAAVRGKPPTILLTLIPEHPETLIEPIVVSEFPFLISKSDDTFACYSDQVPDEYKFLSRRHAHIFTRDQSLLIEDLGSTNGTFVSGSRLDEHARILNDDDTIAFGGNYFLYKVRVKHIEREPGKPIDDPSILTDALNTTTDITRTTFITSANSFIDIFCIDDNKEGEAAASAEESSELSHNSKEKQRRKNDAPGKAGRQPGQISIFLRELRRAFSGEQRLVNRRVLWSGIMVFLAIGGFIGFSYYQGAEKRSIEQLLNEGAYAVSAMRANAYLAQHPHDNEIPDLATKALLRFAIPDWRKQLYENEFRMAQQTVVDARNLTPHNLSVMPLLDILDWVVELEEFFQDRGGESAPIKLFHHEDRIEGLLGWWDKNSREHQRQAGRIVNYEPLFADTQARVLSHLRTLRSEKSLYLNAIRVFKTSLRNQLELDELSELDRLLSDFAAKYPRISGLKTLKQDLRNYRLLHNAIQKRSWIKAIDMVEKTEYITPPFREKVASIRNEQLPPMEIAVEYQGASELWKNGQGDAAITTLESLTEGNWGALAEDRLKRQLKIWNRYQSLAKDDNNPDYSQLLLMLFTSLDPIEDIHFVDSLRPEFEIYRAKVSEEADRAFREAGSAWKKYQHNGRIMGLQRLESKISKKFRDQAKQLTKAYTQSRQGMELHRLLNINARADHEEMYQDILKECRLQIRSMRQLGMVLEPNLLEDKIKILPDPDQKT